MENEDLNTKNEISKKKHLSTIINPLKTGEHSKYLNPKVTQFLKDPLMLNSIILNSIDKLEEEDLDPKERIMYVNTLKGIHTAIFGAKFDIESKNINVNFQKEIDEQATKRVYEILGGAREQATQNISNFDDKDIERYEKLARIQSNKQEQVVLEEDLRIKLKEQEELREKEEKERLRQEALKRLNGHK